MRRQDLIRQLATLAVDLDRVAAPASSAEQLTALCRTARLAFGAAAASVAAVDGDVLRFVASNGEGADRIVGSELPVSRGIAGYVAVSGQALAVDRPLDDPRFARDVAARTGFIPESLLVAPITGADGDVVGVLSVLDRATGALDALELASAFTAQAAHLLEQASATTASARAIIDAVVDAAGSDGDLAAGLRRAFTRLPAREADIARVAQLLASLRGLSSQRRDRVVAVVADVVELATSPTRARR